MEKFKRTFSIRKKKDALPESSKPHQWQEDERKVRDATCSFQVKYLGCIEVFESRGIQICEEAVKALKSRKGRSVWARMSLRKKSKSENQVRLQCLLASSEIAFAYRLIIPSAVNDKTSKSSHHQATLYVTGDALRVVDQVSKGLIVDQTIEKVSFCAPDRNHEKGFAYICRDGTTRRWMCHGFLAIKESGERLSHAVGCAFAICLEKKQQREKEKVTVMYNENGTSFTRMGSFRPTPLSERLTDPQSAIIAEPVPSKQGVAAEVAPYAVQRPHAPVDLLERQGSFRGFEKLSDNSPFKRNVSLRLNELPSTLERRGQLMGGGPGGGGGVIGPANFSDTVTSAISTILETSEEGVASDSLTNDLTSLSINTRPLPTNNYIPQLSSSTTASSVVQLHPPPRPVLTHFPPVGSGGAAAGLTYSAHPPIALSAQQAMGTAQPQAMGVPQTMLRPQAMGLQQVSMEAQPMLVQQPMNGGQVLMDSGGAVRGVGVMHQTGPAMPGMQAMPVATGFYPMIQPTVSTGTAHIPPPSSQFSLQSSSVALNSNAGVIAITQSNPWRPEDSAQQSPRHILASYPATPSGVNTVGGAGAVSDAESWLHSTTKFIDPFACVPVTASSSSSSRKVSTTLTNGGGGSSIKILPPSLAGSAVGGAGDQFTRGMEYPQQVQQQLLIQQQQLMLHQQQQHQQQQQQQQATAASQFQRSATLPIGSSHYNRAPNTNGVSSVAWQPASSETAATGVVDPFESSWESKAKNPFQPVTASSAPTVPPNQQPAFQVRI